MNGSTTGGAAWPRAGFYPSTEGLQIDDLREAMGTVTEPTAGMSLRDWFAGQAMVGYLAAHADPEVRLPESRRMAQHCWQYADAMLEARDDPSTLVPLSPASDPWHHGGVPPIPTLDVPPIPPPYPMPGEQLGPDED